MVLSLVVDEILWEGLGSGDGLLRELLVTDLLDHDIFEVVEGFD